MDAPNNPEGDAQVNEIKLWVDDERSAPDNTWYVAVSVEEAKDFMNEITPTWVSLDYTLGYRSSDGNGVDVLNWMIENSITPAKLTVHSSSYAGRELLIEIAKRAGITATVFEL